MIRNRHVSIVGDIAASTDVTVNSKGGSMTATLRKVLRDGLGPVDRNLAGATIEFANGQGVVLLGGKAGQSDIRVRRLGPNRFELGLNEVEGQDITPLEAAFLALKREQLENGELETAEPVDAAGWRRRSAKRMSRFKVFAPDDSPATAD